MRTSISVHRAACTCTPLAVSLKSSWCNHTETKSSHSIVSGGHNRKLKMNKSALDWCTFPEPFRARCDLFSVHECDAPECIPLLKLLLPEFNLTEANFGKCQDRHTAAEGGWLKGWGSAGRIWQWHLLTRCYRVEPLKNPLRERISLPPTSLSMSWRPGDVGEMRACLFNWKVELTLTSWLTAHVASSPCTCFLVFFSFLTKMSI